MQHDANRRSFKAIFDHFYVQSCHGDLRTWIWMASHVPQSPTATRSPETQIVCIVHICFTSIHRDSLDCPWFLRMLPQRAPPWSCIWGCLGSILLFITTSYFVHGSRWSASQWWQYLHQLVVRNWRRHWLRMAKYINFNVLKTLPYLGAMK